ncbi:MAG: hypothetical protein U0M50_04890, partial [Paramuribaculum sp.]
FQKSVNVFTTRKYVRNNEDRISTSSSALWLNRIARYAQSLTAPNLMHCCDPDVNKFCGMGS